MDNLFLNIITNIPENLEDTDYIENGLRHCGKCKMPKQAMVDLFSNGHYRAMPVACDCRMKEMKEFEQRRKDQEFITYLNNRSGGLASTSYHDYTFANDDGESPQSTLIAQKYVDNFVEMKSSNTGLLIGGPVGTGKTFVAGCIANALLAKKIAVCMTSFPQVINNLQTIKDRNAYIDNLASFDLLILDDLGAERNTEYGLEQLFNLVDARYKSNLPLIVTTNLTYKEMQTGSTMALRRIYDRILEMCAVAVLVDGSSRRSKVAKKKAVDAKKLLGL